MRPGVMGAESLPVDTVDGTGFKFEVIYFGFNKYNLDAASQKALLKNAAYLRNNPEVKVVIEGHCDMRGSVEYNLALGERRARAVFKYLQNQGVESARMSIISYGSERPAAMGGSEGDHAKNRRAVLVRR